MHTVYIVVHMTILLRVLGDISSPQSSLQSITNIRLRINYTVCN